MTDFISIGDDSRYILKEVDGERYMLTIDKFDNLVVGKFNGTDLEVLYSRIFEGLQYEYEYHTTDHYLVFENSTGGIAYNFVTNEIKTFPFSEDYEHNIWYVYNSIKDQIVLRQSTKDFEFNRSKYIDLSTGDEFPLKEGLVTLQSSDYLHRYYYSSSDDFSEHIFINKETLEVDSIPLFDVNHQNGIVDSIYFVYIDGSNVFIRNLDTKEVEVLYVLPSDITFATIESLEDVFAIKCHRASFDNEIVLFNKSDRQQRASIPFLMCDEIFPKIIANQFIYHDWNEIKVYDYGTETEMQLRAVGNDNKRVQLIDERYLVYGTTKVEFTDVTDVWESLGIFDLESQELIDVDIHLDLPFTKHEFIKISDDVSLLNFETDDDDRLNLYELDLAMLTAEESEKYAQGVKGLSGDSELFKVKNDILLFSEDLYLANEDEVVKLNISPIHEIDYFPYKVFEDHITWVEKVSDQIRRIVKFENGSITKSEDIILEGSLFNQLRLEDYTISETNEIFIKTFGFGLEDKLYHVDNGQLFFLTDLNTQVGLSTQIICHSNYLYYQQSNNILVIEENNIIAELDISTNLFNEGFFKFENKLYVDTNTGLYEIDGVNLNLIKEYEDSVISRIRRLPNAKILVEFGDSKIGLLSNNLVTQIDELMDMHGGYLGEDHVQLIEAIATNTFKSSIFNLSSSIEYNLPDSIGFQDLIRVIENETGFILITGEGFISQAEINIYKTNSDFTSFKLLSNFMSSHTWTNADFVNYGKEGFLYADDELLIMDESFVFHPMEKDIVGDPNTIKIIESEGSFFFLAIGAEYGRQLYKSVAFSIREENTEGESNSVEIILFPNPTTESFAIKTEDERIINASLILTDTKGKTVGQWTLNSLENIIDVSQLIDGVYLFSVVNNNTLINAGQLVKMSN